MIWTNWVIAAVILFVIEMLTPGAFFFACLGIGALCAAAISALDLPAGAQWITFVVVSLASIYTVRPLARRLFKGQASKSNVDALVGQKAYVVEPILPPSAGLVKIGGEVWRAEAGEKMDVGCCVEVMAVKGTLVEVRKA